MSSRTGGFCRMLDAAIAAQTPGSPAGRVAWQQLIGVVRSRSRILARQSWSRANTAGIQTMVMALSRVAVRSLIYRRTLDTWMPPASSCRGQFRSLVEHLFVKYPVAGFLINGWFGPPETAHRDIDLFVLIGNGSRSWGFPLPVSVTRRLARQFFSAPDDFTIDQAVRWAQVRQCGGNARLARILAGILPPATGNQEVFWSQMIEFLVRADCPAAHGPLAQREVLEMVDFAIKLKFSPATELLGYRVCDNGPLVPGFCLKGRSLRWMRRLMANWQDQFATEIASRTPAVHGRFRLWEPSEIGPAAIEDESGKWTIEELRDARALYLEGIFMHHCVGDPHYVQRCAHRLTSIWSLRRWTRRRARRVATIEVDPASRQILQAQGKCNSSLSDPARRVIGLWARQQQLSLANPEQE